MYPILFKFGNFELATYGVMSALGYLAALWYVFKQIKRMEIKEDVFFNLCLSVIVGALIGGKLLYLILFWRDYGFGFWDRVVNSIRDFRYGFVFFGGVIGAFASGYVFAGFKKLNFLKLADFFAPAIALGHAIGRIGCFFAGCCYGHQTNGIFGVVFSSPYCLVSQNLLHKHIHPTQLYESFGNIVLFFILHKMLKRRQTDGSVILAYIAGYSILRFIVEFFRGDERGGFALGLSPSQWIAIAALAISITGYFYVKNKKVRI
jgi:phosphatidylglycerol---prolipoprotein diacylglyceryl transferase